MGTFQMSTNVYIDGFNLYYGALRSTKFKWLNLRLMCETLRPNDRINKIRYFTSRVSALPHDQQAAVRQDAFLRALRTIPDLTTFYGRFASRPKQMPKHPITYPNASGPPELVWVLKTEEKRSDVNLATMLLVDCFDNDFDIAIVISNDSDLTLPIDFVVKKFGKQVGVINPDSNTQVSWELRSVASWHYRKINPSVLAKSQFPSAMSDADGAFRKPFRW